MAWPQWPRACAARGERGKLPLGTHPFDLLARTARRTATVPSFGRIWGRRVVRSTDGAVGLLAAGDVSSSFPRRGTGRHRCYWLEP